MLKTKEQKAITLIALIITIIILIILASVAIYLSLGNNGIFTKAKEAKELTNKQEATEKINLKITTAQMNKYAEKQEMPTLKELSLILKEDNEIEYVIEKKQIASAKYEVGESPTSIYTKLNKYPYEFEINSSLQLASINGVKLASKDNKFEIIFVGNLNPVTNNNGLVTTVFDIKEVYDDYKNITIDNFVYKIDNFYDHWNANYGIIGGNTLKQLYDAETGILTINNAFQKASFNSGIEGKVYLIPNIENIK